MARLQTPPPAPLARRLPAGPRAPRLHAVGAPLRVPFLLCLLLSAPTLAQGEADAGVAPSPEAVAPAWPGPAPDGGPGEGAASSADGGSGPSLVLEGLEDPSVLGAEQVATADGGTPPDSYAERLEPSTTLAQRAAAILDRTTLGGYAEHDLIVPLNGGGVSTFRNHRYVLFVYSQISDRISTATEIEFEFAGSPLKRNGTLGFGEVLLEFSVVDVELHPALTLRAGVILVPMGTYNIRHDAPAQELAERPIAYTTIVPTTWFESGVGALGEFELGRDARLSYEAYVINGLDARIMDGMGFRGARGSHLEDNNSDKAVVGRLALSPVLGLETGLSGYTGEYDQDGRRANLVNADLFWRLGPLDLTGEVVRAFIDPGFVQGFEGSTPANTRDRVPTGMFGFYAQANYRFRIEPIFRALPEGWTEGHFAASLRYEEKNTDLDFVTAGDVARLTLGLNFRPIPPFVFKNSIHIQKTGGAGVEAPHVWNKTFFSEPSFEYIGSVAFLF